MPRKTARSNSKLSVEPQDRWKAIVERVAKRRAALGQSPATALDSFYNLQDDNFRTELRESFFGIWVGFSSGGQGSAKECFDRTVRANGGVTLNFGRFDPARVRLVRFTSKDGSVINQLWVDPTYENYASAYRAFAKSEFGITLPVNSGDFLNVDHVFNHARAEKIGLSYVRLALVDADVNQMWGGEYEDAATRSSSGPVRGVRFATDLLLAKAFRLHPPCIIESGEISEVDLQRFVSDLQARGVSGPKPVLVENVKLALNRAFRQTRYRRITAADWERQIFYFVIDIPMSDDDDGPDWVLFKIDGQGRELQDLTEEELTAAQAAVRNWARRNFP